MRKPDFSFSDEGLYEAAKAFHVMVPHEWEPTRQEFIDAMREALKVLVDHRELESTKTVFANLENNRFLD